MSRAALTATVNLLTLRGGPQDFPFDPRLSGVLVIAAVACLTFETSIVKPAGVALVAAIATVAGTALAAHLVLRIRGLEARFLQTWHSMLATVAVLNLLILWPYSQVAPEIVEAMETARKTGATHVPADLPVGPLLLEVLLEIWTVAVWSNIFRHALNVRVAYGVFIAMLVIFFVGVFTNLAVLPFHAV